jgi:hypothetical protein
MTEHKKHRTNIANKKFIQLSLFFFMKTQWKSHNDTYNLHESQLKDERRSGMVRKKLNITTQVLIT